MLEQARTLEGVEILALFINSILTPRSILPPAGGAVAPIRSSAVPYAVVQHSHRSSNFGFISFSHGPGLTVTRDGAAWQTFAVGGDDPAAGKAILKMVRIRALTRLSQPLQATAIYCGLNWLPPFAMHCTFICDDETLVGQARHYKQRLLEWQQAHHG